MSDTATDRMRSWRNSTEAYGIAAMAFHWLMALLFLGNIGLGLYMEDLELSDPWLFPLYQFHKSVGVSVFALVLFRFAWRLYDRPPALPEHMPAWERAAAHLAHIGLYGLLVALPLTGWMLVSASPIAIPTMVFDLFELPHIGFIATSPNKDQWQGLAENVHWLLAWAAIAAIVLHVAAALRHHVLLKDDILRRMLPL